MRVDPGGAEQPKGGGVGEENAPLVDQPTQSEAWEEAREAPHDSGMKAGEKDLIRKARIGAEQSCDAVGELARASAVVLELDVDQSSALSRPLEHRCQQGRRLSGADVHPRKIAGR